jgi:RNA polymerase sigma-54 factor
MTLLSLTSEELQQQIESELAQNPALELVEERRCPLCHRALASMGECPICSCRLADGSDQPIVYLSQPDDYWGGDSLAAEGESEDPFAAQIDQLPVYILRQILADLPVQDRKLAAFLLQHLDDDGLLTIPLCEAARYFHVSLDRVRSVQSLIQRSDPVGVGSTSPQEAMAVQIEVLAETASVPPLAQQLISLDLALLSHKQYARLARQLKATISDVRNAAQFIARNLNPYPARAAWGGAGQPPKDISVFHRPDIIIHPLTPGIGGPLVVEIMLPLRGVLRVNPLYRTAIRETEGEKQENLRNDLERATLFVKCLQQRNHTMQRLLQILVVFQREYILNGEKYLKSITRASLAQALELHESTISRAVANKAVQLPNGRIVPLSVFFDRSLNVRSVLRELIESEPRALSDTELARLLERRGFQVARRTVAKYRAMEGILPAHLRTSIQGAR